MLPLETRYYTPVIDLYRRRLAALVVNEELPTDLHPIKPPPPVRTAVLVASAFAQGAVVFWR